MDWVTARLQFALLSKYLSQCTPWIVLQVNKCEADDVIFTLSRDESVPVIIYSTDSDYLQLVNEHISLYMPHHDDYIEFPRVCKISGGEVWCESPQEYLHYAILTGQGGKDNVYNVKTPTNWDETCGKRKPGFGIAAAKKLLANPYPLMEIRRKGLMDNYIRNTKLIDMDFLPENYREEIRRAYSSYQPSAADMDSFGKLYHWLPPDFDVERINTELAIIAGSISSGASLPETGLLTEDGDVREFVV